MTLTFILQLLGLDGSGDDGTNSSKSKVKKKNKKKKQLNKVEDEGELDKAEEQCKSEESEKEPAEKSKKIKKKKKKQVIDTETSEEGTMKSPKQKKDIRVKGHKGKLVAVGDVLDMLEGENIASTDPLNVDELSVSASVEKKLSQKRKAKGRYLACVGVIHR